MRRGMAKNAGHGIKVVGPICFFKADGWTLFCCASFRGVFSGSSKKFHPWQFMTL